MRKSKFTESQIVTTLKQVEGGRRDGPLLTLASRPFDDPRSVGK